MGPKKHRTERPRHASSEESDYENPNRQHAQKSKELEMDDNPSDSCSDTSKLLNDSEVNAGKKTRAKINSVEIIEEVVSDFNSVESLVTGCVTRAKIKSVEIIEEEVSDFNSVESLVTGCVVPSTSRGVNRTRTRTLAPPGSPKKTDRGRRTKKQKPDSSALTKIISGGTRAEDVSDNLIKQNSDKSGQDGHGEQEESEIGAGVEDNAEVTEKELRPLAEGRISTTPYPSDHERAIPAKDFRESQIGAGVEDNAEVTEKELRPLAEESEIGAGVEDNAEVTEKELRPLAEGRISTTPYPSDHERAIPAKDFRESEIGAGVEDKAEVTEKELRPLAEEENDGDDVTYGEDGEDDDDHDLESGKLEESPPKKKPRGRPKSAINAKSVMPEKESPPKKKPRGRPKSATTINAKKPAAPKKAKPGRYVDEGSGSESNNVADCSETDREIESGEVPLFSGKRLNAKRLQRSNYSEPSTSTPASYDIETVMAEIENMLIERDKDGRALKGKKLSWKARLNADEDSEEEEDGDFGTYGEDHTEVPLTSGKRPNAKDERALVQSKGKKTPRKVHFTEEVADSEEEVTIVCDADESLENSNRTSKQTEKLPSSLRTSIEQL
jgi:hypothetical protein